MFARRVINQFEQVLWHPDTDISNGRGYAIKDRPGNDVHLTGNLRYRYHFNGGLKSPARFLPGTIPTSGLLTVHQEQVRVSTGRSVLSGWLRTVTGHIALMYRRKYVDQKQVSIGNCKGRAGGY